MAEGEERIRVGVADMAVTNGDQPIVTSGLGSCVAVAIHDGEGRAGLLHAMLPEAPVDVVSKAKYVDSGIAEMTDELSTLGADDTALSAKIAGGSSMLDLGSDEPIGDKNVRAAKAVLDGAGIDVAGADTGGDSGRSVSFEPTTGTLRIERVNADAKEL